MDKKFGPSTLKDDEKLRLQAEYRSLLVYFHELTEDKNDKVYTQEELWYELLSNEKYHESCYDIYDFALRFLVRTFNECSVEAQVSFIGQIETSQRPLKHDMA